MADIDLLENAIERAVEKATAGRSRFGLMFSGGLDSSLLANICLGLGFRPIFISVFMPGSRDEKHTVDAAKAMGLDLLSVEIYPRDVKTYVSHVREILQTDNSLDISIGSALYAGFTAAQKEGLQALMVGQGADELFGGYHRYLSIPLSHLNPALKQDVENINLQRDLRLAGSLGLTLLVPYLERRVIELALKIPPELKIKGGERKYILREIAKKKGLPRIIWESEKKAIQYSTGIDKEVKKILKKRK